MALLNLGHTHFLEKKQDNFAVLLISFFDIKYFVFDTWLSGSEEI